jgi:AcrR family transcriptional regulator
MRPTEAPPDAGVKPANEETRQRLLEAAMGVFAEKGYEAASVREITDKAGANTAAINYHFRGKQQLYVETAKYAHRLCCVGVPFTEWPAGTPAADRLRDFVRTMARQMMAEPNESALKLMMREMVHPTEACAEVVREYIRPIADRLMCILVDLLPSDTPELKRWLTGFSIVAQCLHYRQNRAVIRRLMGEERFAALDADAVGEHIADFCLAALNASEAGVKPE